MKEIFLNVLTTVALTNGLVSAEQMYARQLKYLDQLQD